ncbi:tyrosine recombinase XerS (plasmid) [Rossellomorea sp. AcN35-11]|nr:tyrosine recombinase XerS [Rossellomorea aquimaris]WJV31949.1 tyrosine recombinase XerS [Rossellomorea sp. AcN35-11]
MATSRQHLKHKEKYEALLPSLPEYVQKYARFKESEDMSSSTLYNYLKDFIHFFKWLMVEGYTDAKEMKDIPTSVLEHLPLEDALFYFEKVKGEQVQKSKNETKTREKTSVNRKKSSIRSLFKYLTSQSEIRGTGEPYFHRNVMQKITVKKPNETLGERARKIADSIFIEDKDIEFLDFLKHEYEKGLSERKKSYFLRDKERDYAILSVFLSSGVRLNELADLRLRDINFETNRIKVIRKGDKTDVVQVIPDAMEDLREYLEVRKDRYKAGNEGHEYVFVTIYNGKTSPLSIRTIQDLVRKYTKVFNNNVAMSPHKLRHTYATNLLEETKDLTLVMEQLGHTSTSTTMLYVHSTQEKARRAAEALGERRKKLKDK